MTSNNGKLNELIDELYSDVHSYSYGTKERASMIDEIEKLERLRQSEAKMEIEGEKAFDEKIENVRKEKLEQKNRVVTLVLDGIKIVGPMIVWTVALRSQMHIETGDRLMKYNATRNVLNTPKLNMK